MSELIDTTEMYLRTLYELSEEGILPMRARIAERLGQSGPTVSQTVARMARDGLVALDSNDRHIILTKAGELAAVRVMRKHRLVERLLVDVLGMPLVDVHPEACRWEHVISDDAEIRLLAVLDDPKESPFGNPIPGLLELDPDAGANLLAPGTNLASLATAVPQRVRIVRICEPLQNDHTAMIDLVAAQALPGETVTVTAGEQVVRISGEAEIELPWGSAAYVIGWVG
ncbi:MAG: iron dependent repressor, metal binding and dimerization domain protein [Candidatus Nanopelagicales bacterium]